MNRYDSTMRALDRLLRQPHTTRVDELVGQLAGPGIRKVAPLPRKSTRYAGLPGDVLKSEAIRLQPMSGKSKSACAREFGVARETLKDWLDPLNRPRSFPPEDFVEWLACIVDARSLVRVA